MPNHTPRRIVCASASTLAAALSILSFQPAGAQAPSPQAQVNVGPRWACRPADSTYAPNASLTHEGKQLSAHCVPLNVTITTSTGRVFVIGNPQQNGASSAGEQITVTSPTYTATMTASDVHNQWVDAIRKSLSVEQASGDSSAGPMMVGDRWVCEPVSAAHPQNAVTTDASKTPLSCREVNLAVKMPSGRMMVIGHTHSVPKKDTNTETAELAPPSSAGLTPQQMADNWNNSVYRIFDIATSAAGGG